MSQIYQEPLEVCCISSNLEHCQTCENKKHCFIVKEQLAFYNRLGLSQIEDNIDLESLKNIKHLWQDFARTKRYDPSWDYADDNTRAYTHPIHPYPAMKP